MAFYFCFSAFNEEDELPRLLQRIHAAGYALGMDYRIVAYDDGSKDATQSILQAEKNTIVVTLGDGTNRGLGHGILSIMQYLSNTAKEEDVALFMDADNTHDPADAARFLISIQQGADLVVASRFLPQSRIVGFPQWRWVLSVGASLLYRTLFNFPIKDFTGGFRCYRVSLIKRMFAHRGNAMITRKGFECQLELLSAMPAETRITEIPFVYDYTLRVGKSKIKLVKTIFNTLTLFFRLLFRRCQQNMK